MEKRTAELAAGANIDAQMPVRLFPRLARRAHAVSAVLGRFHASLTQAPQIWPLRPLYLLRTQLRLLTSISPCSRRCLGSPRITTTPHPPILRRLPIPNARVRTFDSDCAVWQAAGAAGAAAMVSDTSSATAQLPAAHVSQSYTHPTRGQRSSTAGFRGS